MSTQTVLTQSINQGTVVSASVPWSQGASSATAQALMSSDDASNPSNSLSMYIAASYDAQGSSWARQAGFGWQGGPNGGNTAPVMQWNPDPDHLPTFVRVEYDISAPVSIGATLDVA